jgi:hypothetical protein
VAEANLQTLVARCEKQHSHLANWLAEAVHEGLTVFGLPETHRNLTAMIDIDDAASLQQSDTAGKASDGTTSPWHHIKIPAVKS